jgi:hypothetical protein
MAHSFDVFDAAGTLACSCLPCEQALFELSLKFEREPAGLANKNASVRCLERRRVPIG